MEKDCENCKYCEIEICDEPCVNCKKSEDGYTHWEQNVVYDNVSTPLHYNTGSIEVIEYIADQLKDGFVDYCMGNVVKYVSRYKHKNGKEDLQKAKTYIEFALNYMESGKAK